MGVQGVPNAIARIEVLTYDASKQASNKKNGKFKPGLGWHRDRECKPYTMMMLSDENDFTGGEFETATSRDFQKTVRKVPLKKGDAVVFYSRTWHRVTPVQSGVRKVLAVEFFGTPVSKD